MEGNSIEKGEGRSAAADRPLGFLIELRKLPVSAAVAAAMAAAARASAATVEATASRSASDRATANATTSRSACNCATADAAANWAASNCTTADATNRSATYDTGATIVAAAAVVTATAVPATAVAVVPGAGADEYAAGKPIGTVEAVGGAGIRVIIIVAIGAHRRSSNNRGTDSDTDRNLGVCGRNSKEEKSKYRKQF